MLPTHFYFFFEDHEPAYFSGVGPPEDPAYFSVNVAQISPPSLSSPEGRVLLRHFSDPQLSKHSLAWLSARNQLRFVADARRLSELPPAVRDPILLNYEYRDCLIPRRGIPGVFFSLPSGPYFVSLSDVGSLFSRNPDLRDHFSQPDSEFAEFTNSNFRQRPIPDHLTFAFTKLGGHESLRDSFDGLQPDIGVVLPQQAWIGLHSVSVLDRPDCADVLGGICRDQRDQAWWDAHDQRIWVLFSAESNNLIVSRWALEHHWRGLMLPAEVGAQDGTPMDRWNVNELMRYLAMLRAMGRCDVEDNEGRQLFEEAKRHPWTVVRKWSDFSHQN
jgi:hypothetical protein